MKLNVINSNALGFKGEEMIRKKKCPQCRSKRIAGPHRLHGDLFIDLPGMLTAGLQAFTCANCGYTEFYSDKEGRDNINRDGRFVINRRPTHCPSCKSKLGPADEQCPECGEEIEFAEWL
ncbi:MAG: hypothetical protein ACXADL_13585 [Candidatus Thorarchaeota archaeon]